MFQDANITSETFLYEETASHNCTSLFDIVTAAGHKSINSTLKYISLEKALFKTDDDQWITRVVKDIQEGQKLVMRAHLL